MMIFQRKEHRIRSKEIHVLVTTLSVCSAWDKSLHLFWPVSSLCKNEGLIRKYDCFSVCFLWNGNEHHARKKKIVGQVCVYQRSFAIRLLRTFITITCVVNLLERPNYAIFLYFILFYFFDIRSFLLSMEIFHGQYFHGRPFEKCEVRSSLSCLAAPRFCGRHWLMTQPSGEDSVECWSCFLWKQPSLWS